jgi:ribosome-associated toxin RatA of RatAB toxin-antitoxin module
MRRFRLLRGLVLSLVLVSVLAPAADTAMVAGRTSEQDARLASGEVLVSPALPPGADVGALGGTVAALVHASPDAVWEVLVDYPHHSGLFPRVVGAQVLESAGRRTLVRYVIAVGPFSFGFHVNNYPDPGHRQLDWRLANDRRNDLFRASTGYWRLEPHPHGVVLTYAMAARTVLPAFVTRGAERDGLVETIKAVRERAEQRPRQN